MAAGTTAAPAWSELWRYEPEQSTAPLWMDRDGVLLAVGWPDGRVGFYDLHDGALRHEIARGPTLEAGLLWDNLFLGFASDRMHIVHLTPHLTGERCRSDRNGEIELPGALRVAPARQGRRLALVAGPVLLGCELSAAGVGVSWRQPLPRPVLGMAWGERNLWLLEPDRLRCLDAEHGGGLLEIELERPGQALWGGLEPLVFGARGELWKIKAERLIPLLPENGRPGYAWAVARERALICHGRRLSLIELASARRRELLLPQPCVLAPVLTEDWFLLAGYDGMFMRFELGKGEPQLSWTWRPFPSYEPIAAAPLEARERLVLAGPEGQLLTLRSPA